MVSDMTPLRLPPRAQILPLSSPIILDPNGRRRSECVADRSSVTILSAETIGNTRDLIPQHAL